uniref:FAD-dependent oxidoreductase domain-containing protein 2-like n=1 Tax=Phallusia mammillata TaxID=59560 RepID=A0A6F9DDM3_9ASCI|nr:FAD-dependent oxidoreductase domain-containing protein 2-like [Phallusia mammillata]
MNILVLVSVLSVAISSAWAEMDPTDNTDTPNFHKYCIIGAGPGGLQIAYFMQHAQRDYIVFEKGHGAGTFYNKYPIHRQLISINKRNTGKTNKEFNMRHDWNSLLSHDESLQMTKYSKVFFPPADVLVKYLNDYMTKLNLNVQVNTTISNLLKRKDKNFEMYDQRGTKYTCQYMVIATGIASPNKPEFSGWELSEGYEDLSIDVDDFEKQSVLILGRGNSAFETAQHIMGSTNVIHMMARSRVKLSWATHYVGDLRAVNNGLLDTYQLKSLDGLFEGSVSDIQLKKSQIDGRLYVDNFGNSTIPGGEIVGAVDNDALREGYDRVIRCLGFLFDHSLFHPSMKVRSAGEGGEKYPRINFIYEAVDVKGMFFAGTNTHSLDFKRSAGGFIHGYRYTAKSLHNILEWRHFRVPWPSVYFENLQDLIPHMHKRVNEGSGIYQMFGVLCDVVIYNEDKTAATYLEAFPCALACKLPKVSGHKAPGAVMFMVMEYGKNFSGAGKDTFHEDRAQGSPNEAHRSNFLHPVFYHYDKLFNQETFIAKPEKWVLPVPDHIHHLVEDFTTKFDGMQTHILQTRRFIETTTGQDLRHFYGPQCLALALTSTSLPYGCQQRTDDGSASFIDFSNETKERFSDMSAHLLPFVAMLK